MEYSSTFAHMTRAHADGPVNWWRGICAKRDAAIGELCDVRHQVLVYKPSQSFETNGVDSSIVRSVPNLHLSQANTTVVVVGTRNHLVRKRSGAGHEL